MFARYCENLLKIHPRPDLGAFFFRRRTANGVEEIGTPINDNIGPSYRQHNPNQNCDDEESGRDRFTWPIHGYCASFLEICLGGVDLIFRQLICASADTR
jgi:hypothetical protein